MKLVLFFAFSLFGLSFSVFAANPQPSSDSAIDPCVRKLEFAKQVLSQQELTLFSKLHASQCALINSLTKEEREELKNIRKKLKKAAKERRKERKNYDENEYDKD